MAEPSAPRRRTLAHRFGFDPGPERTAAQVLGFEPEPAPQPVPQPSPGKVPAGPRGTPYAGDWLGDAARRARNNRRPPSRW
jgi:hypothetical protein